MPLLRRGDPGRSHRVPVLPTLAHDERSPTSVGCHRPPQTAWSPGVAAVAVAPDRSSTSRQVDPPRLLTSNTDAAFDFVQRFGIPDTDESSENEDPRPPIVTRMLTYQKEHVRAIFRRRFRLAPRKPSTVAGRRWASPIHERTSPSHEVRRRSRHSSSGRSYFQREAKHFRDNKAKHEREQNK